MDLVKKYFPNLSEFQYQQFNNLKHLITYWNSRVNLVSREDITNFEEHHVLHSLSIAQVCEFASGTRIIDVGTGGGLPGLPLAIMFPETNFVLVDSIEKKVNAVYFMAAELALHNVIVSHGRAQDQDEKYDFIISRAVADAYSIVSWCRHLLSAESRNDIPNGFIMLKGGNLDYELGLVDRPNHKLPISNFYEEPYFANKFVVYISGAR